MMRRTNGLALMFFIALFAAGAAVGVVADRYIQRGQVMRQWGDQRAMRNRLADDLGMSAEQRASMDSLLDDRNRQYETLMAPMRPTLDSLGAATRQRLRQLLTPEQQATYDQIQREREEARRREKQQ
jgi:Spy/CpxP family protein refolding chaperone